MERTEILKMAIKYYKELPQMDVCAEECAELIKALMKHKRNPNEKTAGNIREEIADVQIMLDQMRLIFGPTAREEAGKLERLQHRIGATEGQP